MAEFEHPRLTGIERAILEELAETYGYSLANLFRKALIRFLQAESEDGEGD